METTERTLATVRVTLEPSGADKDSKPPVAKPSRFAVWITTEQGTELYGIAANRMAAAALCQEIADALGVQRGMEV